MWIIEGAEQMSDRKRNEVGTVLINHKREMEMEWPCTV